MIEQLIEINNIGYYTLYNASKNIVADMCRNYTLRDISAMSSNSRKKDIEFASINYARHYIGNFITPLDRASYQTIFSNLNAISDLGKETIGVCITDINKGTLLYNYDDNKVREDILYSNSLSLKQILKYKNAWDDGIIIKLEVLEDEQEE